MNADAAGTPPATGVDLLIVGGTVITVDPQRRVLRDGAIAVSGNRITAVGPTAEISREYHSDHTIDARGRVVTPGLIQAHVHVSTEQAVAGVLPDTMPPSQWVRQIVPFYAATTAADEELIAAATFCELIRTGTTTFIEAGTTKHTDRVVAAMGEVGIRGCLGTWSWDIPAEPANLAATTAECLARTEDLIERFHHAHDDRVRIWATPIGHTMTSDELLTGMADIAVRHDTGFTCHLSSWREDVEGYLERTGMRPVEYYAQLGVLGPHAVLAHMVDLDEAEVELVLETDTRIAHCPTTAGWFGYGLSQVSRFPEMLERGATIGIGCDAKCCSNNLDIVRAMYTSAVIFRDARRSMEVMGAEQMTEMATLHGARCAQQADDLGSIEVGKKADFVVFDARRSEWRPLHHPVATLVFGADGHSVDTVVIDGQVVCADGEITTIDEQQVLGELEVIGKRLLADVGWETAHRWPLGQDAAS